MFFLWMLVNIVLLSSGGYVFLHGNQQAGWILIGVGLLSLIMWFLYYRNRKNRKSSNDNDVCWAADVLDCFTPSLFKKLDCDCGDGDCGGFDCTP